MCKRIVGSLSESDLESECRIDNTQQHQIHHRERFLMDSANEDNPRVKFLCSFSGSILPRPQDGKLRYVGGETRIVSVARDVSYEELMVKMREIFEGVEVLKYQQPDEDLDALVSVVNDDDVTNMMEEYDKLGEGGGFSRLRVFLVSQSDQECSFADVDERDNEIWYFDALNSFNESPELRRQQNSDFHRVVSFEDVHLAEQYFNRMNLEGSVHNQRNFEVPAHVDLRHLRIPHHNDSEVPWSPSYYSPRQTEAHDPRGFKEFPTSPSTGRFRTPYSEFSDQGFGRMPEEYNVYEHPIQHNGFPGNIYSNVYEGSSTYENSRINKRNQSFHSSPWNPDEQPHRGPNISSERLPYRDTSQMNSEANPSYVYGADKLYHVHDRHVPSQTIWKNIHSPLQAGLYDVAGSPPMAKGSFSPRLRHGMGSPQKIMGFDGQPFVMPLQSIPHIPGLSRATSGSLLNNLVDPVYSPGIHSSVDDKLVPTTSETESRNVNNVISTGANSVENNIRTSRVESDILDDGLNFLPELMASVREAKLENVKEVRAKLEEGIESGIEHVSTAEVVQNPETNPDLEIDSDSNNRIEPTEAEEEAIKRGLQTIRNEDLEEIRELGSGTFGSVFYGKWKGSDVAIKRIKARCFAGKPSERQRLITDFWKEALMLSSLHHPNVVSFFGVVRDGPDGSLATVTELMVNGSLKQFLRKKDRTIDRRKRLLIAMDAAFGMEYLHGKNIVHFDLKCENLLVNMRDPHRPVCKIGDLGLSKVKQSTLVSGGVRGTLPWMAPELLSGKTTMVTEKIDVYSFGIVMWELLTGDEPYSDMHCASVIGGIVNDSLRPEIPTWCDPEWKSLMESSWASDPGKRPSFCGISQKLRTMAAAMNLK